MRTLEERKKAAKNAAFKKSEEYIEKGGVPLSEGTVGVIEAYMDAYFNE